MKIVGDDCTASIARQLRDDEVHIWLLPYTREQKRGPLVRLLGAYLGISGDDVALVDGEFGRPSLDPIHGTSLGFNWSHSGAHALVAIGRHLVPGIDIERRRPRARAIDIAEHYFHEDELAALVALPADACSDTFLQLWTAKEAVLKALGRGIAFGLDRLHVASSGSQLTLRWLDGEVVHAWQLQRLAIGQDYMAALAWRGGTRRILCWTVEL
jgi:4'-phosphopantetheinyl transferase